jgi:simple sugar transport system ATP-binding protein
MHKSQTEGGPVVALRGITKRFPGVVANDHVSFSVYPGEVHALLGENGAGKSTLVKILYGFYLPDSGEIFVRGRRVRFRSPHDARRDEIGMVFQEFTLIPALTVLENIALFLPRLPAVLNPRKIARRIEQASHRYGLELDPETPVWQLSIGQRQRVELMKLLLAGSRILILDEPTKVLAPHEVEGLFSVMARLKGDGYSIVFISHKLREVLACSDRITVMRRGKVAGSLSRDEATEERLISLMFGTQPPGEVRLEGPPPPPETTPVLELKNVSTRASGMATPLRGVDLVVRSGEIVGVAGVAGNGQKELGDVVLGIQRCSEGRKLILGKDATGWSPAQVREAGVAFIPEDPLAMAAAPGLTVLENMALGAIDRYARWGGLVMEWPQVEQDLTSALSRLELPPLPSRVPIRTLSGGSQQRMVIARELSRDCRLVVAFYPTRGLDVLSANSVRRYLVAAREAGKGVLLISEDLGELFSLSDRLAVMYRGQVVGEFAPADTTLEAVGRLMTGAVVHG